MLSYFEPGIRPCAAADLLDKIYQRFLRTIGTDLPKDGRAEQVVFEVRYRPDDSPAFVMYCWGVLINAPLRS
jgi:hypothetical protein